MGEEVDKFEKIIAIFWRKLMCCKWTADKLALQAIGIKRGDEVLVQSLTYLSSFQAISATGAVPVACDVKLNSGTIDLLDARKINKTKAIMPVHWVIVGDLDEIYKFAKNLNQSNRDAAYIFGSTYKKINWQSVMLFVLVLMELKI